MDNSNSNSNLNSTQSAVRTDLSQLQYLEALRRVDIRLLHAAIGLCTETGEISEIVNGGCGSMVEEIGDMTWYLRILCDWLKIDFELLAQQVAPGEKMVVITVGELQDHLKRAIFYGTPLVEDYFFERIKEIIATLKSVCKSYHVTLEQVVEANVRKLKARYPEKFESDRAVNRDIPAEQRSLQL